MSLNFYLICSSELNLLLLITLLVRLFRAKEDNSMIINCTPGCYNVRTELLQFIGC